MIFHTQVALKQPSALGSVSETDLAVVLIAQ